MVSIGAFAGRGFSELVQQMFEQYGVIMLGISEDDRVVLHPGAGFIISEVQQWSLYMADMCQPETPAT